MDECRRQDYVVHILRLTRIRCVQCRQGHVQDGLVPSIVDSRGKPEDCSPTSGCLLYEVGRLGGIPPKDVPRDAGGLLSRRRAPCIVRKSSLKNTNKGT